jgi:hypothetical protein
MKPLSQLGRLFVRVPIIISGVPRSDVSVKTRDPTPDEREQTASLREKLIRLQREKSAIEAEIKSITKTCQHLVCYDVDAYPYYDRYCAACDRFLEMI